MAILVNIKFNIADILPKKKYATPGIINISICSRKKEVIVPLCSYFSDYT